MSDSSGNTGSFGDNGVIQLMGNIILAAFIFIFIVIAFVFCHHLYAKWFWQRRQRDTITPQQRHLVRTGIDSSLLKTIPVIVFDPEAFKDGLECSVCLSEVGEGEKIRLLPKCNHGFHLNCIDMWFESRTTCPLCRSSVVVDDQNQSNPVSESALETTIQSSTGESSSTEATNFPTNVLFWGNETQVENSSHHQNTAESSSSSSMAETSNRRDGVLVIDIPRQRNVEEDQKSPPVPTRLGSLKRLLSGKIWFTPSSPRNLDLEQGGRSES